MSLIIEGSDNLGKTIFAKKLIRYVWDHDEYPVMYSWMTRPNEATFDFAKNYRMMINSYTIQDRFHLGAIAYHKNKILAEHLNWIEEWIRDVGGFVVLLFAKDEDWYKKYLVKDKRGNLLANEILCKANSIFTQIAMGQHPLRPSFSYAFDISSENFIDDKNVEHIAEAWMKHRRRFIKELLNKTIKQLCKNCHGKGGNYFRDAGKEGDLTFWQPCQKCKENEEKNK